CSRRWKRAPPRGTETRKPPRQGPARRSGSVREAHSPEGADCARAAAGRMFGVRRESPLSIFSRTVPCERENEKRRISPHSKPANYCRASSRLQAAVDSRVSWASGAPFARSSSSVRASDPTQIIVITVIARRIAQAGLERKVASPKLPPLSFLQRDDW